MKQKMTVRELKKYYDVHQPKRISFLTENQPWYNIADPCKVDCAFSAMMICENPNMVYLKSGGNSLCFDQVKSAEVDTTATVLGDMLTLYCGANVTYILVVS